MQNYVLYCIDSLDNSLVAFLYGMVEQLNQ